MSCVKQTKAFTLLPPRLDSQRARCQCERKNNQQNNAICPVRLFAKNEHAAKMNIFRFRGT